MRREAFKIEQETNMVMVTLLIVGHIQDNQIVTGQIPVDVKFSTSYIARKSVFIIQKTP